MAPQADLRDGGANPYRESARILKAIRLANAFTRALAAATGPDGTGPEMVARAAVELAPDGWARLATEAGERRPPSEATVALAVALLGDRARRGDPFDRL